MEVSGNSGSLEDIHEAAGTEAPLSEHKGPEEAAGDLIMYLARRNIRLRHNFFRHTAAWGITLPLLALITDGFWAGPVHGAFFGGFYFAWAILILHKLYIIVRSWLCGRIGEPVKTDPVIAEYERLKAVSAEKITTELKRL